MWRASERASCLAEFSVDLDDCAARAKPGGAGVSNDASFDATLVSGGTSQTAQTERVEEAVDESGASALLGVLRSTARVTVGTQER